MDIRFRHWRLWLLPVLVLLFFAGIGGCSDDDDDDNDASPGDDDDASPGDDDDASPVDDDVSPPDDDDSVVDDDSFVDDDDDNDNDDNDDDNDNDNDDDNDNNDNNDDDDNDDNDDDNNNDNNDNDNDNDNDDTFVELSLAIEKIDGGPPGEGGFALLADPDGGFMIPAISGRDLLLYRRDAAAAGWSSKLLASLVSDADFASDSAGRLHAVFVDQAEHRVVYGILDGDEWVFTTIADDYGVDYTNLDLALDANDRPHVRYWAASDREAAFLFHAADLAGDWVVEQIDDGTYCADVGPLLIDGNGRVSFACYRGGQAYAPYTYYNTYLNFITNRGGSWTIESIRMGSCYYGGSNGYCESYFPGRLGLLSDGRIVLFSPYEHYSFNGSGEEYHYKFYRLVRDPQGGWSETLLQGEQGNYLSGDLVVDRNDRVRVAFTISGCLHLGLSEGEAWTYEPVLDQACLDVEARLDENDDLHLACRNIYQNSLTYLTDAGDGWTREPVDQRLSLARAASVYPLAAKKTSGQETALVYWSGTNHVHTYLARGLTGNWTVGEITNDYSEKGGPALAVDASGDLHTAYRVRLDKALYGVEYGTNAGGEWSSSRLNQAPAYRETPVPLVIDGGQPRLFYVSEADELRMLRRDGETWTDEVLFTGALRFPAAAEAAGVLHLCFIDNGVLQYADDRDGAWNREPVTDAERWVYYCAIAVAGDGTPYLAYSERRVDTGDFSLVLAEQLDGQWQTIKTIGYESSRNQYEIALAVAADRTVHLVYRDDLAGGEYPGVNATIHVMKSDNKWRRAVIDYPALFNGGWYYEPIGKAFTMLLDQAGRPHWFYYGFGALWHATLKE